MSEPLILSVPAHDSPELLDLASELDVPGELDESRYFDGDRFADLLVTVPMHAGAWLAVRAWVLSRADVRKSTRISWRGLETEGIDAEEFIAILRSIENSVDQPPT